MRATARGAKRTRRAGVVGPMLLALLLTILVPALLHPPSARAGDPPGGAAGDRGAAQVVAPSTTVSTSKIAVDAQYPYAASLKWSINSITPTVVTTGTGNKVTVRGTIKNISKVKIYDLQYVWQRGLPLTTVKAVKTEIATPGRPTAVVGQDWRVLTPDGIGQDKPGVVPRIDLPANSSMPFTADVDLVQGLDVSGPGIYPLMIKISGDVGQNGQTQYERVGEIHLVSTVLSLSPSVSSDAPGTPPIVSSATATAAPTTPATATTSRPASGSTTVSSGDESPSAGIGSPTTGSTVSSASSSTTDIPTGGFPTTPTSPTTASQAFNSQTSPSQISPSPTSPSPTSPSPTSTVPAPISPGPSLTARAVPVNVLWPIVDIPHVGVAGVFLNDDLAQEISPGGRLYSVLLELTAFDAEQSKATIVVDPELLEEIQKMSGGYRVVTEPGRPQAALTATSVTPSATGSATTPATTSETTGIPSATSVDSTSATVPSAPTSSTPTTTPPVTTPSTTPTAAPATSPAVHPTRARTTPVRSVVTPAHPTGAPAAATTPKHPDTTHSTVTHPATSTPAPPPSTPTTSTPATSTPATSTPTTPSSLPTTQTTSEMTTPTTTVETTTATATGASGDRPPADTVAGSGQAAATAFLTMLREATADRQVLVLPYSDPDAVAMVRAGLKDQLAGLINAGRSVAGRVLRLSTATAPGRPGLITSVAVPEGGLVDDETLAFLSSRGLPLALLAPGTVRHAGGPTGSVRIDETANGGTVVDAAVTDSDLVNAVTDLVNRGTTGGAGSRLNNLAALMTAGSIDGTATPLIVAPGNRWTPNAGGLSMLSGLLRTLEAEGVVAGTPLTTIAAGATVTAVVSYPATGQSQELDPGYLARVAQDRTWLANISSSLSRSRGTETPIPGDVLDPLRNALNVICSAGLRGGDRIGRNILATTESTLGPLQAGVAIIGGTSYTLVSSTAPLLVIVRNDLPFVVTVRVQVIDAQLVGMTATDPGLLSIPAGRSQQFKIETKVVKAGKFPVRVELLAADGSVWAEPTTITVTSSAYGALTIVLIAVAGAALLFMVVIRIVQRVRGGNPRRSDASTDDVPEKDPTLTPDGSRSDGSESDRTDSDKADTDRADTDGADPHRHEPDGTSGESER